ncbi:MULTISPECIES: LacI family DNA-binding transcriptional regulator [Microbacterium]|uniref:LacI family DNA-binding transcriptional regulator n=1 Tax=Microbacterium TaxID=33882 RepID=UPI001CB6DB22|nr:MULTISPECIES: LacI family DNA-binding transcriptional regulator [Microbacterium]
MNSHGVNIQRVAEAAGVSKTTVSHVLSGNRPVAPKTRARVERVISDLGFRPNFFARALNTKKSNAIALVVQDITNPFYPALARGLQTHLSAADQVVMLFDAGGDRRLVDMFARDAIARHVDGVVVAVSDMDDQIIELQNAGISVVAVGSGVSELSIDWVSGDDERIGSDAVRHLSLMGRSSIGCISGPSSTAPADQRLAGYKKALAELGVQQRPDLVAFGDWTRDGGFRAMSHLLDTARTPPDAVFCANDLMAIGSIDALSARRLDVPADIAIIGVDDIEAARLVRPSLSTIRIPAVDIGQAAGELLLRRIDDGDRTPSRHVVVQHQLVSRESA